MKKQELKNDPIRDYIVNAYNYFDENKNITYSVSLAVIFSLFVFVYLNNNKTKFNLNSSVKSGITQNLFLLSEQSGNIENKNISIQEFNSIVEGDYNKESINQAVIYLIKNAKDNNEDIITIIDKNYFNSDDEFLNSYYNGIVGDYYSKSNNFKSAINYYEKCINSFDNHYDTLIDFKLSYIFSLIKNDDLSTAINLFKSIDYEKLSFGSKNKYDIFKNNYSSILK